MALQIIIKQRFTNRLKKLTKYLKEEFGENEAHDFYKLLNEKIVLLSETPNIGSQTAITGVKSVLVGKGRQNKVYYKVDSNQLVIIDMKDTRINPKKNLYYKK